MNPFDFLFNGQWSWFGLWRNRQPGRTDESMFHEQDVDFFPTHNVVSNFLHDSDNSFSSGVAGTGLFEPFSPLSSDSGFDDDYNPATGLPMMGGIDIAGNLYGCSSDYDGFSGVSSVFDSDDSFSSSSSSFDSDWP